MRFCCKHTEAHRQRMCEKALDALATAPYARGVSRFVLAGASRWTLRQQVCQGLLPYAWPSEGIRARARGDAHACGSGAGVGPGARAAASVSARCSREVAGVLLLAYPLQARRPVPLVSSSAKVPDPLYSSTRAALALACMLIITACRHAPSAKQWVTPGSARRRRRRSGGAGAPAQTRPRPPSSRPRCGTAGATPTARALRKRWLPAQGGGRSGALYLHAWCTSTGRAVHQQVCRDGLAKQALDSCM